MGVQALDAAALQPGQRQNGPIRGDQDRGGKEVQVQGDAHQVQPSRGGSEAQHLAGRFRQPFVPFQEALRQGEARVMKT